MVQSVNPNIEILEESLVRLGPLAGDVVFLEAISKPI